MVNYLVDQIHYGAYLRCVHFGFRDIRHKCVCRVGGLVCKRIVGVRDVVRCYASASVHYKQATNVSGLGGRGNKNHQYQSLVKLETK
jgi:hypothetical protein